MYSFIESVRSAAHSIRAHAFRSFLTTLGIIIGVASVIAVVSVIQGLSHSIGESFKGLGAGGMSVRSSTTWEEAMQGRRHHLSLNDYYQILHHVGDIEHVSPTFTPFGFIASVRFGAKDTSSNVEAVTPAYQFSHQRYPQLGRFIDANDVTSHRKVAFIGTKVRDELHLPENPIGQFIQVGSEWLKVVGMGEAKGESFGFFDQDNYVLMPFTVGASMMGDPNLIDIQISFSVKDLEQQAAVQDRIAALLRQMHHLKPGEPNDFKVQTANELRDSFANILNTVTLVLGGIVGISLLVGGIGIMNIMLVSVTERTREIGICKALGAQRHHILLQFLIEATVLSLFGGAIGLALGYGLGIVAAKLIPDFPAAHVPMWAVGLAFGFSALVGIVFGIMPAAKAANLEPIDALRYE